MLRGHYTYDVQRRSPVDAEPDLARLWADNLVLLESPRAKFERIYRDAPDVPDTVLTLSAATERATPQVVGTAGIVVRHISLAGREARAALMVDLAVDQHHRSAFPALKLVRALKELALSKFELVYGFPNQAAEKVFERAGFRPVGRLTRYARVLRHAHYATRLTGKGVAGRLAARAARLPGVAKLAGATIDVGPLAVGMARAARAATRFQLRWIDNADGRFDQLWEAARDQYPIAGKRSAEWLHWRYPPTARCLIATLIRRGSAELRAYAILQPAAETVHIRDLFGHTDDLGALLDLLIPALYARGFANASICLLAGNRVSKTLTSRGFRPREADRNVAVGVPGESSDLAALVRDAANWHLFDFDEDE